MKNSLHIYLLLKTKPMFPIKLFWYMFKFGFVGSLLDVQCKIKTIWDPLLKCISPSALLRLCRYISSPLPSHHHHLHFHLLLKSLLTVSHFSISPIKPRGFLREDCVKGAKAVKDTALKSSNESREAFKIPHLLHILNLPISVFQELVLKHARTYTG